MLEIIIVRTFPLPETDATPPAVPVFMSVTFEAVRVLEAKFAPEYVTSNVTGPPRVMATDGAEITTVGGVFPTMTCVLAALPGARLPGRSRAVPARIIIP